jgi:hypothetical protein
MDYAAAPNAEFSRQIKSTAVGSGTASGTNLVFKKSPIQPVGSSAMFGGTPTSLGMVSHHISSDSARGDTHPTRQFTRSARHESVRDPSLLGARVRRGRAFGPGVYAAKTGLGHRFVHN